MGYCQYKSRMAGLAASTRLTDYRCSSSGISVYCYAELAVSFLAVGMTIASAVLSATVHERFDTMIPSGEDTRTVA